jgi:lysophospholipid acyltransferase (LPLAT)-like uncharacterized protein
LIVGAMRLVCATLRLRREMPPEVERLFAENRDMILVTWHGRTLIPVHDYRGRGYWALISLSRDGDLQTANFRRLGFRTIRGSTGRRGAAATREVLTALQKGGVLTFTPDGPRGPSHKAQPGVVYFAQRSGRPIVPFGVSASPRWLLRSWDRFLIPKPFARAFMVYGEPLYVSPDTDLDQAARDVEAAINRLEDEAEGRAAASAAARRGSARPDPDK